MNAFEAMILRGNWLVLDTETTGFPPTGEVCQIGIIDCFGKIMMDQLVKPSYPIPWDATNVHGITDAMVALSPLYTDIHDNLCDIVRDKDLVIYNADFDWHILQHCASLYALPWFPEQMKPSSLSCAMLWYADIWNDWSDYHHNNRYQKLGNACRQQGIITGDLHSALADATATRDLILKVMHKTYPTLDFLGE